MLSFAPKADGTFPESQKRMMYELGEWLKQCGEAVYATRPYQIYGELGESWLHKDEHGRKQYIGTKDDVRFTRNKENSILYATILDWPGEKMTIKSLASADLRGIKKIQLLGVKKPLKWKKTNRGLEITMPKKPTYGMAYPIKIVFEGQIASVKIVD